VRIRLLIQNPFETINDWQKDRVLNNLRSLHATTLKAYKNYEIRAYSRPASVRGRLIDGKHLLLGWYAYSIESKENPVGVHGHDNPVLVALEKSDTSLVLFDFFQTAFDDLWNHPETIVVDMDQLDMPLIQNVNVS